MLKLRVLTLSKCVWANIDGLKSTLDGLILVAIIRGDNPKETAKWLTCAQACKVRREMLIKIQNGGRRVYKMCDVPDILVHPNCMCSISAYWVYKDKKNFNSIKNDDSNIKYDLNDFMK